MSAWHGRSILFRTTDGFDYAVCLGKKEDVPRVIEEFIEFDGSALPEVMIDPDAGVHPMVGPEISYREMITADFVPNR